MNWVMQYRTRRSDADEWSEWKDLPESLIFSTESLTFSTYYNPLYFEFRATQIPPQPSFIFGTRIWKNAE